MIAQRLDLERFDLPLVPARRARYAFVRENAFVTISGGALAGVQARVLQADAVAEIAQLKMLTGTRVGDAVFVRYGDLQAMKGIIA